MRNSIITLAFFILTLTSNIFPLPVCTDNKTCITSECLIFFSRNKNKIVFKARKKVKYIIAHRGELSLRAYQNYAFLHNIKNLSSDYNTDTIIPKSYTPVKTDANISVKKLSPEGFKRERRVLLINLLKQGYILSEVSSPDKTVIIKAEFKSDKLFLPLSIFLLNGKMEMLKLKLYILSEKQAYSHLFNTLYAKRFIFGSKKMRPFENIMLKGISKILDIKNRLLSLTLLCTSLPRNFVTDTVLNNTVYAPFIFTKKELTSLTLKEGRSLERKLYLTGLIKSKTPSAFDINFIFKLWQTGEYNSLFFSGLIANKKILIKIAPELFALDAINRVTGVKKYVVFRFGNSRILRVTPSGLPFEYRILYSSDDNISSHRLMLFSSGIKVPVFKKDMFIYKGNRRIIALKRTAAGVFSVDYDGYRKLNWHRLPYNEGSFNSALNISLRVLSSLRLNLYEAGIINGNQGQQ
jgi:hypothetical protein